MSLQTGQKLRVQNVVANYTAANSDDMINVDASGGARTITLSSATLDKNLGKVVTIKKTDSSVNAVTVTAVGGQTIDGLSSQLVATQNASMTIVSNGTNWMIIEYTGAIAASYWLSANFVSSTTIPINFDSKEYDTHSAVTTSPTAWRFTAPVSGLYSVNTYLYQTTSTQGYMMSKNGSFYKGIGIANVAQSIFGIASTDIRLNAGEYIDFRADASTPTTTGGTLATLTTCKVSIKRTGN
jgi:hypothetical protein